MADIIPVILAKDFPEFQFKLELLRPLNTLIQIDVVDGKFAPHTTFGVPALVKGLAMLPYEVDLMVERPLAVVDAWMSAGAERILFHVESKDDPLLVIQTVKKYNKEVGISLNTETPWQVLLPYIGKIDCVLFKGVHSGASGQAFIPEVLEKIRSFHAAYPALPIEIDGGVTLDNVQALVIAGATRLATASALFKTNNIQETFYKLDELCRISTTQK